MQLLETDIFLITFRIIQYKQHYLRDIEFYPTLYSLNNSSFELPFWQAIIVLRHSLVCVFSYVSLYSKRHLVDISLFLFTK